MKDRIVMAMAGTKETSIFPKRSSPSVRGVARRASMVFLSFSPAKLSDAMTLEAMTGISRKNGANMYTKST